ncbi:MAG: YncE family protein [Actinomycetota bacterium]
MKRIHAVLLLLALAALAACGKAIGTPRADDTLFLRSPRGIAVIETGAAAPSFKQYGAVPSGSWGTVVRTDAQVSSTRVIGTDPTTGTDVWADVVPGHWRPKVVSQDGTLAALGPDPERFHTRGRARTSLLIAGDGSEARRFDLRGNYEPEAFSTAHDSLFVVKYIPALKPKMYQVRRLNLRNGRVLPVYTPHKELQETMGGTARIQAASPDGNRLYTLYTVGGAGDSRYAFIHVLALDEEWAHCIDLPDGFADQADTATALTVSPDNERLYIANSYTGALAAIDTTTMQVVAEDRSSFASGESTHVVADADTVYVGTGYHVTAFDAVTLHSEDEWTTDEEVTGMQVSESGADLYVGLWTKVQRIYLATGKKLEEIDPPGIKRIQTFGPVTEFEEEPVLKCAC